MVKERARAVQHSVPFTAFPVKMVTHMVFFVVKHLNYFPANSGISTQFSPKTIMSGQTLNYKQCSLPFGTYCQVHEEEEPRNGIIAPTAGVILLGPSSNRQGGHLFLSLNTGRVIARRSWTVIQMPQAVIDRVNTMAADQPRLLTFLDRSGLEIMDEEFYNNKVEDHHNYEIPGVVGIDAQIPGVDKEIAIEDTAVDKMETVNDMSNKPSTTTEPEPLLVEEDNAAPKITFDTNVESAEPMETPAAVVSPTETRDTNGRERPSRTRSKPKSYVPSMTG